MPILSGSPFLLVIFEGKYVPEPSSVDVGEVPGAYYGMSDKGWTDQELICILIFLYFYIFI